MKIAVVCANGKAGRLITQEAARRGLDVTAFVRRQTRIPGFRRIKQIAGSGRAATVWIQTLFLKERFRELRKEAGKRDKGGAQA